MFGRFGKLFGLAVLLVVGAWVIAYGQARYVIVEDGIWWNDTGNGTIYVSCGPYIQAFGGVPYQLHLENACNVGGQLKSSYHTHYNTAFDNHVLSFTLTYTGYKCWSASERGYGWAKWTNPTETDASQTYEATTICSSPGTGESGCVGGRCLSP